MGDLFGFPRNVIVLMAGMEAAYVTVKYAAVVARGKLMPIHKVPITITSIMLHSMTTFKIIAHIKGKGMVKAVTMMVALAMEISIKGALNAIED